MSLVINNIDARVWPEIVDALHNHYEILYWCDLGIDDLDLDLDQLYSKFKQFENLQVNYHLKRSKICGFTNINAYSIKLSLQTDKTKLVLIYENGNNASQSTNTLCNRRLLRYQNKYYG